MCTDRFPIKIDPLACYDFSKNCDFFNFSQFLEKSQFLLDTLVPPVTLDLINFSKNCNFSNYSQFLEKSQKLQKSQFLLDALVPPLPPEFSNFRKNCDFSNFSQFLLLRANLDMLSVTNIHFRH